MEFSAGTHVQYRLLPDMTRRDGVIEACDDATISLRMQAGEAADFGPSQYILLSDRETELDAYGLVTARNGDVVALKRMWTGRRGYFRVDDVFPVLCRTVDSCTPAHSRLFPGGGAFGEACEGPDESVSPRLWRLLNEIDAKLGLILEHLRLDGEGLITAPAVPVNVSASGLRLRLAQPVKVGDLMEIKMLLPLSPAAGLLVHGSVVRVDAGEGGTQEVALQFTGLDNEAQDVLIRYTLNRQRESIWKLKAWERQEA